MSSITTNTVLLEVLGLASLRHITSVDIALRPNELPLITVQQKPFWLQPTTARFRLHAEEAAAATDPYTAKPVPPIDRRSTIDVMAEEALRGLHRFIHLRTSVAHFEMFRHSVEYPKEHLES